MTIESMTTTELNEKLQKKANVELIDVREINEWEAGHIAEAKFIPLSDLENQFQNIEQKDFVVLQCRSGARSLRAAEFLKEKGLTNLYNLEGGILDWQDEGFPVVKDHA